MHAYLRAMMKSHLWQSACKQAESDGCENDAQIVRMHH